MNAWKWLSAGLLWLGAIGAAQAADGGSRDLWAEAQISENSPYVQQSLIYMVLVVSRASAPSKVDPVAPAVSGVNLHRLDDQPLFYPVTIQGRSYQVSAFRYELTPLTLGKIEVPPARIEITMAASRAYPGYPSSGKKLELQTNAVHLDIQPPASAQQPWLPLHDLKIEAHLEKGRIARAGDPLTLTVTLQAIGTGGDQLPSFAALLAKSQDFKVYPERPHTEQRVISDGKLMHLAGLRSEVYTLIPQRIGELELPKLQMAWWDTRKKREAVAEWPVQIIPVVEAGAPVEEAKPEAGGYSAWYVVAGIVGVVLFIGGWWVGAGRPGQDRIKPILARILARAVEILPALGAGSRRLAVLLYRYSGLAALHNSLRERWQEWRHHNPLLSKVAAKASTVASHAASLLPAGCSSRQFLRAIEEAKEPAQVYGYLRQFSHVRLNLPARAPLPQVAERLCQAYPHLDAQAVQRLLDELEQSLYAGAKELSLPQWKRDFYLYFNGMRWHRPRLKETSKRRALPELNPGF